MLYFRLVQIVSAWVALCHWVLGIAGLVGGPPLIASLIRLFYGAEIEIDATLFYVVKLVAVYFIVFAAVSTLIAVEPVRFLALVPIVVAFFVIRTAELIFFYQFVGTELNVPDHRLTEKIVSFVVIAALLGTSAYKLRSTSLSRDILPAR